MKIISILPPHAGQAVIQDVMEDITQSIDFGDRLEQRNLICSQCLVGLLTLTPAGTVFYANPTFLKMTNLSSREIIGKPANVLCALLEEQAEISTSRKGLIKEFISGNIVAGAASARPLHLFMKSPLNSVIELTVASSATNTESRLLYLRDVTHAAEVDRMKSEFLSHAAHELRTPMASIYGFTELLLAQEFDAATRKDLLQTIHKQTAWLIEIINELLDISRIESRRGKDFKVEPVPVVPLVADVLSAMQIDNQRWPVKVDLPVELPTVRADVSKLRQVLMNILGNAVKYSPDGGPITISGTTCKLDDKTQVSLTVTDRGIGMTEEQVARVCERFYRADTSGNIPGTGLGMAIVKEVVELLGGRIDVASALGTGTVVTLWFPVSNIAISSNPIHQTDKQA